MSHMRDRKSVSVHFMGRYAGIYSRPEYVRIFLPGFLPVRRANKTVGNKVVCNSLVACDVRKNVRFVSGNAYSGPKALTRTVRTEHGSIKNLGARPLKAAPLSLCTLGMLEARGGRSYVRVVEARLPEERPAPARDGVSHIGRQRRVNGGRRNFAPP